MAPIPSFLQGLNEVQPEQQPSGLTDAQDLLQSPPFSHDLAAQLELWSNVHFSPDDSFLSASPAADRSGLAGGRAGQEDADSPFDPALEANDEDADPLLATKGGVKPSALLDASSSPVTSTAATTAAGPAPPPFASYFTGFGNVDAFHLPPGANFEVNPSTLFASSGDASTHLLDPSFASFLGQQHGAAPAMSAVTSSASDAAGLASDALPTSAHPPAKKARTASGSKKASNAAAAATTASSNASSTSAPQTESNDAPSPSEDNDADEKVGDASTTPLNASEDKRRRNTAASARFRLKKKEREQAMEKKAKDLESRVGELERECEALRRENGWLRGLVVGVTGNANIGSGAANGVAVPASAAVAAGTKRSLDE